MYWHDPAIMLDIVNGTRIFPIPCKITMTISMWRYTLLRTLMKRSKAWWTMGLHLQLGQSAKTETRFGLSFSALPMLQICWQWHKICFVTFVHRHRVRERNTMNTTLVKGSEKVLLLAKIHQIQQKLYYIRWEWVDNEGWKEKSWYYLKFKDSGWNFRFSTVLKRFWVNDEHKRATDTESEIQQGLVWY